MADPGFFSGLLDSARIDPEAVKAGLLHAIVQDPTKRRMLDVQPGPDGTMQPANTGPGFWKTMADLTPIGGLLDAAQASRGLGQGDPYEQGKSAGHMLTSVAAAMLPAKAGSIRAYHASPHDFPKFSFEKIGTGEGAQAYGHGLYFAESPAVSGRGGDYDRSFSRAMPYKYEGQPVGPDTAPYGVRNALDWIKGDSRPNETLAQTIERRSQELENHGTFMRNSSDSQNRSAAEMYFNAARDLRELDVTKLAAPQAHIYDVNIHADPQRFLDWDKPLREQPNLPDQFGRYRNQDWTGRDLYQQWDRPNVTSQQMQQAGIPGIRYLDSASRGVGEGSRNTVVFPTQKDIIEILRKYGLPPALAGSAAAAMPGLLSEQQDY